MEYLAWLYLALPCFVANSLPVIFQRLKWLPNLNKPLDGGAKIFNQRLFGDHKTIRGLLVGVVGAMIVGFIQYLFSYYHFIVIYELPGLSQFLFFSFLAGLGALAGDAVESLVKRQLKIASGDSLIIFDQLDYVIGFLLLTSLIISWPLKAVLFLLLFSLIAHPISNWLSYVFKIKKTYW